MRIVIIPDLTLSPLGPGELARIESAAGEGSTVIQLDSDAEALQAARSMQVLFGQVTPELFAAAPALEWVHSTSSGIDHLLFPAFKESDVVLTGEKGLVGPHLADHAMGLLLALTRKIAAAVRDGPDSWAHRVEYRMAELELEGLKLCVVGFGGTGRCIAKRAAGFDMHVSAIDLNPVEGTTEASTVEPMSALPDRLAEADVVAVCLPLTPETRELFDARMFERMKPGAILINVTRGEIIDHRAMLAALESGRLGGAGLDVHYREPLARRRSHVATFERGHDTAYRWRQSAQSGPELRAIPGKRRAVSTWRCVARRGRQEAGFLTRPPMSLAAATRDDSRGQFIPDSPGRQSSFDE